MSEQKLREAQLALQSNDLRRAESLYRSLLEEAPSSDIYYGLGVVTYQKKMPKEALVWIDKAITGVPDNPTFYYGKAVILFESGLYAEAILAFEKTLDLKPDFTSILFMLAVSYVKEGLLDQAEKTYELLLHGEPENVDALNNLGNIYLKEKRVKRAIQCFKQAIRIQSSYENAYNNLGTLYLEYGKLNKALFYFENAIKIQPNRAYFYNNLASTLRQLGRIEEAIQNYEKAIHLDSQYVSAYRNLAFLCKEKFQFERAVSLFQKVLSLEPTDVQSFIELGDIFLSLGEPNEAIQYYEEAYSLEPRDNIKIKLARALPCIYQSEEEMLYWRTHFEQSFVALKSQKLHIDDPISQIGAANFYLAYQNFNNCSISKTVSDVFSKAIDLKQVHFSKNIKPRIGFCSAHFKQGHTILKFYLGILNQLSREKFDIYIYGLKGDDSLPIQAEHQYTNLRSKKIQDIFQKISRDKLDLLFYPDIGMEPFSYFLAYNRLAPVQCQSWGHPETSGIPNVDYFISSDLIEVEGAQSHYSEALIRLKTLPTYYYTPQHTTKSYSRNDFGFSNDTNIYLCPQSLFKLLPDFDEILAGILRQDPKGQLVLMTYHIPHWQQLLMKRFQKTMPDVIDKVVFLKRLSEQEFLGLLSVADVVLDTLHFGGGNTTYETLFQGTPIVTLPQAYMKSRITYGCYQKMGVLNCIAASKAEYIEKAVRLGTDQGYRDHIKEMILMNNQVLFEDQTVMGELESFFLGASESAKPLVDIG